MEISIKSGNPEKQDGACVVVGIFEQRKPSLAAEQIDKAAKGYLSDILRRGDMDGKQGSTLILHNVPGMSCERVLLVGLGKENESDAITQRTKVYYRYLQNNPIEGWEIDRYGNEIYLNKSNI